MNLKRLFIPTALAAAVLALTTAAIAYSGRQYAAQAAISITKARAIALKTLPGGKIAGEELEREAGGSGLRYSFDVRVEGTIHEVGVDARTGKVLENSIERPNSD